MKIDEHTVSRKSSRLITMFISKTQKKMSEFHLQTLIAEVDVHRKGDRRRQRLVVLDLRSNSSSVPRSKIEANIHIRISFLLAIFSYFLGGRFSESRCESRIKCSPKKTHCVARVTFNSVLVQLALGKLFTGPQTCRARDPRARSSREQVRAPCQRP